ncbi:MAG: tyrosine--tRNA ligase [bacterium]|nr:tyrosine--tRNA ligase [bacterium]
MAGNTDNKLEREVERQLRVISEGTLEVITEEGLRAKLRRSIETGKPLVAKLGADPTAPDIHLGHSVVMKKMRELQDLGHKVIFLIGDFTALIGDPSGRSKTRPSLSRDEIESNAATYREQCDKILDPEKTIIDHNSRWADEMDFADVIRLSAKYTLARMLERDDFAKRYDNGIPISIHELLYPLLQAYDSVALKADIELGGNDQKFNLMVARDIMREYGEEPEVALIMPILVGTDGVKKMSKSLGNYIGINEPAAEIFGKVMSLSDEVMFQYYEILRVKPPAEVKKTIEDVKGDRVHPMDVKKELARYITSEYWDDEAAKEARSEFEKVHQKGGLPDDIDEITPSEFPIEIIALIREAGFASSNGEARRLVRQGGVSLNGEKITDVEAEVNPDDGYILKVGKRRFARIRR